MEVNEIKKLIADIENIAGPCFYDCELNDINDINDVLELHMDEYPDVGIEIDIETLKISIFVPFSYYDFTKSDLEQENHDIEEIEQEERTQLLESSFTWYLRLYAPNHLVSVWDDGCYMCPGFVSRVGFCQEYFTDKLLKDFLLVNENYWKSIGNSSNSDIRKFVLKSICHNYSISIETNPSIKIRNASIKIYDIKNELNLANDIEHYYLGKEYFLFSAAGLHYAADAYPVKIFMEANDSCELFNDLAFVLDIPPLFPNPILRIISSHMELFIDIKCDMDHTYSYIEELTMITDNRNMVPFASDQFKDFFYKAYPDMVDILSGKVPLIITEGSTDWKHLKKYWELYGCQYSTEKIDFLEYEPANSSTFGSHRLEMGSSSLLQMCSQFSKIEQERIFIFIADRDETKIIREMGGGKKYKYWGNNVYSLVLPLPEHRSQTPEICIEHYYTDKEIKTPYVCEDGVTRRLFLGDEFDRYGRNIDKGLLCIKRNLCGPNSIKIIDGSSDARVISIREKSDLNYALSKSQFATCSELKKDSAAYVAFKNLFEIILEIIQISQKRRR